MKDEADKPRLIAFEVTRRCRYTCRHCRADSTNSTPDKLTTEQCRKILESVARFQKCVIIVTGGEPMERSDIYELIRYGRSLGLRMVMATCGYLINEESIVKLKDAGIEALSFSLDGASAQIHDAIRQSKSAFASTLTAAERAGKAGIRFQINTTITKFNADEIVGIIELAKKLGAYCFNPFILVPTGRARQIAEQTLDPVQYEVLLNELLQLKLKSDIEVRLTCAPQLARLCAQKKLDSLIANVSGCMGARGFGFISCRGDVQACGFLDISAGNLVENGFDFGKIWSRSRLLNEIRNTSMYQGNCGICEYVGICGGCRARAFAASGNYLGSDPICSYTTGAKS